MNGVVSVPPLRVSPHAMLELRSTPPVAVTAAESWIVVKPQSLMLLVSAVSLPPILAVVVPAKTRDDRPTVTSLLVLNVTLLSVVFWLNPWGVLLAILPCTLNDFEPKAIVLLLNVKLCTR